MSDANTTQKTHPRPIAEHDWSRLDAMTEEEKHAAALSDPDNPPLTEEGWKHMKRVPRTKTLRRALGLTQEEFSTRFHIPIGTLRDWEQGRAELRCCASTSRRLPRSWGECQSLRTLMTLRGREQGPGERER